MTNRSSQSIIWQGMGFFLLSINVARRPPSKESQKTRTMNLALDYDQELRLSKSGGGGWRLIEVHLSGNKTRFSIEIHWCDLAPLNSKQNYYLCSAAVPGGVCNAPSRETLKRESTRQLETFAFLMDRIVIRDSLKIYSHKKLTRKVSFSDVYPIALVPK